MSLPEELSPPGISAHSRRRRNVVSVVALSLLLVGSAALTYRASYQPLARGGLFGGSIERLSDGVGTTGVKVTEDHGGTYTLSVRNDGHLGVTIVGAGTQDSDADLQIRPVSYRREAAGEEDQPFTSFTLGSGEEVDLTVDVRLQSCEPNNLSTVRELAVRFRFLGHEREQLLPLEVPIKAVCGP